MPVSREELIIAAMAPADGRSHTPVQMQKLLFILDENAAARLNGPHFRFEPYHYGPFDKEVYETLDTLSRKGLVDIAFGSGNWREYSLTPEGQSRGQAILNSIDSQTADYIREVSNFVRKLSFSQLVSAVYKAYPRMRARSVFQD